MALASAASMLEPSLYSLVIRAILNEESQPTDVARGKKSKGAKTPSKRVVGTLELAEKLRQLFGTDGEQEQQRMLAQNQNWVMLWLDNIGILTDGTECHFRLQITSGENCEEHFLSANEEPIRISLPQGRHSVLRVFPAHSAATGNFSYNPKAKGTSAPPSLHPSSTSSSSTPSLVSSNDGSGNRGSGGHFGLNSLAAKSSCFLRRWTRAPVRNREVAPLLVHRLRNVPANETQRLEIAGGACLQYTLKKTLRNPEFGGFQPMELSDFIAVLRAFKAAFLQRLTDSNRQEHSLDSEEAEQQDDLSKAFRHFNELSDSTESTRKALAEIARRVARFNEFSATTHALLEIGVCLEDCHFDCSGDGMAEKRFQLARASIDQHLARLGQERIGTEQELKAAIFLAERLAELFTEASRLARRERLLLPPLFSSDSQFSLGVSLTSHLSRFEQFTDQLGPLLDLIQMQFWEHPGLSGLASSVGRLFDQSFQQQLAQFVSCDLAQAKQDLDSFGDLVDSLRLFLLHPSGKSVEKVLELVWLPFPGRLLQAVDDPLCMACKSLLQSSVAALKPRDSEQAVEFTKASMRLFDAFGQLAEMAKQHCEQTSLQLFEPWFEEAAVYWTGTWRSVYVGFVHKCVEESAADCAAADASTSSSESSTDEQPLSLLFQQQPRRSSLLLVLRPTSSSPLATSPPRLSRQFVLADFSSSRGDLQMHEATVNCLAFCKALCDDFLRLGCRQRLLLLATFQVTSILADCLTTFCTLLLQQLKANKPTVGKMLLAANGIEHASAYLAQNFERFLDIKRLKEANNLEESEKTQALESIRRIMGSARNRCRAMADRIVGCLCERKTGRIRHGCALLTRNWEDSNNKKTLRCYLRQMLLNERQEQLLLLLDGSCVQLHSSLLPRLYASAQLKLWQIVRRILELQLLRGQPPEYYKEVERACEAISQILLLEWSAEHSLLRRLLHANKASSKELILQYYAQLGEQSSDNQRVEKPAPRVCLRLGYVRTTGQQVLLQVHVLAAFDIPVLDTLTRSSDPYLRLELLPRFLFPLNQFPAQSTETKKQSLNPKWNQIFQIAVPEQLFFMHGACLSLTCLDHDVMTYNDLAGQAFLPLASLPRLRDLAARSLPPPRVLALRMPDSGRFRSEAFQILEQRSAQRDQLAREAVGYEKYLRDYHILPPSSQDDKEWTIRGELRRGRDRMCRLLNNGIGGVRR